MTTGAKWRDVRKWLDSAAHHELWERQRIVAELLAMLAERVTRSDAGARTEKMRKAGKKHLSDTTRHVNDLEKMYAAQQRDLSDIFAPRAFRNSSISAGTFRRNTRTTGLLFLVQKEALARRDVHDFIEHAADSLGAGQLPHRRRLMDHLHRVPDRRVHALIRQLFERTAA